jgi:hypothetical protein
MHYELRRLESVLKQKGNNDLEALIVEQARIEHALLEVIYSDKPDGKITTYVQQHAKILLELLKAAELLTDIHPATPVTLEQVIIHLLGVLEKHGNLYWDYQLPAPSFVQQPILEAAQAGFSLTRETIALMPVDKLLAKTIENDLHTLLYHKQPLCYGQLYLLRDLPSALSAIAFNSENSKENTCRLIELLCRYNFNSRSLYDWGIQEIREREINQQEETDSIFTLRRLQFFFKRIQPEPDYCYRTHQPVLSLQFSAYLNDQLDHKRREMLAASRSDMPVGTDRKDPVIHTSFTQEVLCFLVRLLLELHLFRSHNKRNLARFLANWFTTVGQKKAGMTDASGVSTALYSASLATVMKTEDILHQLLKRLQVWKQALKTTGRGPADEISESW